MSDDLTLTNNATIYNLDGSKAVTITTDGAKECLDVNIQKDSTVPVNGVFISKHLRLAGSADMDVNGSGTPKIFTAGPPVGKRWYISRILVAINDTNMTWFKFGGVPVLTNGIELEYKSVGITYDLFDGQDVKQNSDWGEHCFDAELLIGPGTLDVFRVRWTFSKAGTLLLLNNADGDTFTCTVNDNLNGLDEYRTVIQGYEVDE